MNEKVRELEKNLENVAGAPLPISELYIDVRTLNNQTLFQEALDGISFYSIECKCFKNEVGYKPEYKPLIDIHDLNKLRESNDLYCAINFESCIVNFYDDSKNIISRVSGNDFND